MAGISNEFSWSKTRNTKFNACRRDYYLRYYRSWGGWEKSATNAVRSAYVLKKLENRYSWSGKVMHDTIAKALAFIRNRISYEPAQMIDDARLMMRRDYNLSSRKLYWTQKIRQDFGGLMEHEHGEPITKDQWTGVWADTEQRLGWWFGSRWPELAKSLRPEQWLAADVKDFRTNNFQLNGVKVYAIPDFAYLTETGAKVVDWKTGAPRESTDGGVVSYALFLQERFGIDASTMESDMVYLSDGSTKTMPITQGVIDSFVGSFDESVAGMKSLLLGKGNANRPHPEEAFPKTENLDTCRRCVYRAVCNRSNA